MQFQFPEGWKLVACKQDDLKKSNIEINKKRVSKKMKGRGVGGSIPIGKPASMAKVAVDQDCWEANSLVETTDSPLALRKNRKA